MVDYFTTCNRDNGEPSGWEGVHDKEGSGRMESVRKEGEGKGWEGSGSMEMRRGKGRVKRRRKRGK